MGNEHPTLPPGYRMTELGPLPEEWQVVKLGEVVSRVDSGDWGVELPTKDALLCSVIRGTDFSLASAGISLGIPRRYVRYKSLQKRKLSHGDVLVELSGGSKDQPTGRILLVTQRLLESCKEPITFSNFVKRLELIDSVMPEFFHRYWQLLYQKGATRIYEKRTTGIRNFKLADFLMAEFIPLPPLPEQRAIAHVLWTVQEAKEATERVVAALRDLKKSLMCHLFTYGPVPLAQAESVPLRDTEIGPIPEHWRVVRLGEIMEKPQYGYTASAIDQPVGPKFLRITDIQNGQVLWSSVPFCAIKEAELEKYLLKTGDILVARIGATTGKTFLVTECPVAIFASYLIRIRVLPDNVVPDFLWYFTHTQAYWEQINSSKGGRLKQGINIPVLQSLVVRLPPLPEQQQIAAILQAIDRRIQAEENYARALEGLLKTLLHDLMTARRRLPPEYVAQFATAAAQPTPTGRETP